MDALGRSAWLITLALAGVFFALCAHVEIRLAVLRQEGPATASLRVRWLFLQVRRQVNLEDLAQGWLRRLLDSALVRGRPGQQERKVGFGDAGEAGATRAAPPDVGPLRPAAAALAHPGRSAVDSSRLRLWRELISQAQRAAGRPWRYLRRNVRCSRLQLHLEVGAGDAMETALLCGGVWAVVGSVVAIIGGWVGLDESAPDLCVQPNFDTTCLRLRTECILRMRVANAIIAAIWFASRLLREKGLVAWMRDRRFRKGVVQDGGAPDSGTDENGHGIAQNDGGRQHGRW